MNTSAPSPDPSDLPDDLLGQPDADDQTDADLDDALEDDVDLRHRAPLIVDAAPLHALVDELTTLLHGYVDTAVGVRAEFDAATAEDDPRVEDVEDRIARLNNRLGEAFEKELGLVSGHTGEAWDDEDADDDEDEDEDGVYELSFTVSIDDDRDHDETMDLIDGVGSATVDQLEAAGLAVQHWGVAYMDTEEDEDDEE